MSHSGLIRKSDVASTRNNLIGLESFRKWFSVQNDDRFMAKLVLEILCILHPLSRRVPCYIMTGITKDIKSRKLTLLSRAHIVQSWTVFITCRFVGTPPTQGYRSVCPTIKNPLVPTC